MDSSVIHILTVCAKCLQNCSDIITHSAKNGTVCNGLVGTSNRLARNYTSSHLVIDFCYKCGIPAVFTNLETDKFLYTGIGGFIHQRSSVVSKRPVLPKRHKPEVKLLVDSSSIGCNRHSSDIFRLPLTVFE